MASVSTLKMWFVYHEMVQRINRLPLNISNSITNNLYATSLFVSPFFLWVIMNICFLL